MVVSRFGWLAILGLWAAGAAAQGPIPAEPVPIVIDSPPASTWDVITFKPVGSALSKEKLDAYLTMLRSEMGLYSADAIRRAGLKSIVVVVNLKNQGAPVAVVPDPYKGYLYCDPTVGDYDAVYQRHVVHHDFFHYLMGRWNNDMYFKDPKWIALCPPGTKWGTGGINAQTEDQYPLTRPAPGFVNKYSMSGVEEDMAEVFAVLMVPDEMAIVEKFLKEDAVLRAKFEYMRRFVEGVAAKKAATSEPRAVAARQS